MSIKEEVLMQIPPFKGTYDELKKAIDLTIKKCEVEKINQIAYKEILKDVKGLAVKEALKKQRDGFIEFLRLIKTRPEQNSLSKAFIDIKIKELEGK